jgi:hypothetical protein
MGLSYWVTFTVFIFVVFTRFTWDVNKYAFYRLQAMFLPQSVLFYFIFFWVGLNGYSAWLVWYCHNWDEAPATLIVYVVKIMVLSFIGPAFMLTTMIWIPITTTIVALILSIVNCILFSIKNEWAGVCGVVDIAVTTIILFELSYLSIWKHQIVDEWFKIKEQTDLFSTAPLDTGDSEDDETPASAPSILDIDTNASLQVLPNPADEIESKLRSRRNRNIKNNDALSYINYQ